MKKYSASNPREISEKITCQFKCNPDDGLLVRAVTKSNRAVKGDVVGCHGLNGYLTVGIDGHRYYVHRLCYFIYHGVNPNIVDHINNNKLDNRKENLRSVTPAQNKMNQNNVKTNKSGITGVCWDKSKNKWASRIMVNYKMIHLGYFTDIKKAAEARRHGEKKYFKEFRIKQ